MGSDAATLVGQRWRAGARLGALALVGVSVLAACSTGHLAGGPGTTAAGQISSVASSPATSSSPPTPAVITTVPLGNAVNPASPITVSVAGGTLESVRLTNPQGKLVKGALSTDHTTWTSTEDLGYSKTYALDAVAENSAGTTATKKASFTTLTPSNLTMPYLDDIYGAALQNGATYGVGMIPVVNFDERITDKAAAARALQVVTSPHVDGAWYWLNDSTAHWRPQHFYAPGTTVTINAKVYGIQVGPGLYGQADQSVSYKIGDKRVTVADASTHEVNVYWSDKLVRTMPTSMGRGGYVQGTNGPIALWTMPGTYTVLGFENPAVMSSDSYGLPSTSAYGYPPEDVYWSTKISTDGIYLHELDTTVWAQGNSNVSHGCLNLNHDNAQWFFQHSRVGDVVQVAHSGGPTLQVWQGGDWTLPWAQWAAGGTH